MSEFEKLVIQKLENIEERVTNLEEDVTVLRSSTTIIEDRVTREIPALFEAYDIDKIEQKSQRTEINSLSLLTEEHDVKISALQTITDDHSKKLKTLIS